MAPKDTTSLKSHDLFLKSRWISHSNPLEYIWVWFNIKEISPQITGGKKSAFQEDVSCLPWKTTKNPQVHMVQDDNHLETTLEKPWKEHSPHPRLDGPPTYSHLCPNKEELWNKITSVNWEFQEGSYLEKEKLTKNSFFLHLSFQTFLLNYHTALFLTMCLVR